MEKILIICAHPDDEVLGCGGTLLKHKKLKDQINILFVFEGSSAVDGKIASKGSLAVKTCSSWIFGKRRKGSTHCCHCTRKTVVTCIAPHYGLVEFSEIVNTLSASFNPKQKKQCECSSFFHRLLEPLELEVEPLREGADGV